jgi:hypothetical protein
MTSRSYEPEFTMTRRKPARKKFAGRKIEIIIKTPNFRERAPVKNLHDDLDCEAVQSFERGMSGFEFRSHSA